MFENHIYLKTSAKFEGKFFVARLMLESDAGQTSIVYKAYTKPLTLGRTFDHEEMSITSSMFEAMVDFASGGMFEYRFLNGEKKDALIEAPPAHKLGAPTFVTTNDEGKFTVSAVLKWNWSFKKFFTNRMDLTYIISVDDANVVVLNDPFLPYHSHRMIAEVRDQSKWSRLAPYLWVIQLRESLARTCRNATNGNA